MTVSPELQLAVLIWALYLQDAAVLLHSNEGVLTSASKGAWKLGLGTTQARIKGKNLYFPNLLMAHRPHYRMQWDFEADAATSAPIGLSTVTNPSRERKPKRVRSFGRSLKPVAIPKWAPHLQEFFGLGLLTSALGFLQLVMFPAVMFLYQTDLSVISTIVAIYVTIFFALWVVWTKAPLFGLTRKKFAALSFECLVCPPLAINLVRRFSLDMCKSADLVEVAGKLMDSDSWISAQQHMSLRIEEQMSVEPEDSQRYAAMQTRLELFSKRRRNSDDD